MSAAPDPALSSKPLDRLSRTARRRLVLMASVVGAMLVALDGTVLMVAQPSLRADLGAGVGQVQWTSTAYLLAVASLLVLAGRLGDRYGHVRLLCLGALGFAATSVGIALAPDVGWVIGLRGAQGVFGALLQPATLALLRLAYPAERLPGAVALRTSAIGVAAAAGPLLGGVLVAQLGWRAVFVLNVPVALAAAAAALTVRAPTRPSPGGAQGAAGATGADRADRADPSNGANGATGAVGPERLDPAGATLLAAALAVLVHTLVGVPDHGWSAAPTLLGLLAAVALAALLAGRERRSAHPVVPVAVARSVPVTASMGLLLLASGGLFGALFTATFLLQDVLGLGPLATGLHVLPLTALMVLGAPVAARTLRRYGPRANALTGSLLLVSGSATLSQLGAQTSSLVLGVAFALLGAGFTAIMVTATGTVVGDAPPGHAGVVGGLKQTAMNVGPTLGIAVAAGTMRASASHAPTAASTGPALLTLAALMALTLLPAALLPRAGSSATMGRDGRAVPVAGPVAGAGNGLAHSPAPTDITDTNDTTSTTGTTNTTGPPPQRTERTGGTTT